MLWGENRGEWKSQQSPGIEPGTPGLCSQCSATELRQPDNHQPSQSSICTAQVGTEMPQLHTWQPISVCRQNSIRGWPESSLIRREPMLSGFSQSKCLELLPHVGIKRNWGKNRGEWSSWTVHTTSSKPSSKYLLAHSIHFLFIYELTVGGFA